jgi:hypothetical protein
MKIRRACAFAAVTLLAFLPLAMAQAPSWEDYEMVSMIQLIATPQQFEGRKVHVCGFAVMRFEATALYLTRDDRNYSNRKNGLWLDLPDWDKQPKSLRNSFVQVFGVFRSDKKGHKGAYSGTLEEIARMEKRD